MSVGYSKGQGRAQWGTKGMVRGSRLGHNENESVWSVAGLWEQ